MSQQAAWIIVGFPLASFLLIVFGARRWPRLSGWLAALAVLGSFVASVVVFLDVAAGMAVRQELPWLPVAVGALRSPFVDSVGDIVRPDLMAVRFAFPGPPYAIHLGFQVDPLTAIMLLVVTSVSFLVQVYSTGYMEGDRGYARYFAFMSLFAASMLGLVLASNLLALYVFWELVGLCSYLLIGHWHERPEAAAAAKKAFIVTRLGDFGLLLGILFLYWHTGTFEFARLAEMAADGRLADPALTAGALLIFAGAVGKSAQFPLHVWLPDAMEGPTPVSALIHAATMVAAGVYLMARTFPLLEHSPTALAVVATVGGFTALFAATMGLVSNDIKRVLAYSTMSQLGYMMLGIGVGAMAAGMFHLFNHAFFKALLFLCAGSVIHLVHTNDLFEMGGLRRWRPETFVATTVAALSLSGLFPLSGFWSKDEILVAAARTQPVLYALALATVFLTAFYMFRVIFLAFGGRPRGHVEDRPEAPAMTVPILLLIIPSVASGLLGAPMLGNAFGSFLDPHHPAQTFTWDTFVLSTGLGIGGILLAWRMYGGGRLEAGGAMTARLRPIYDLLANRYYLDDLYNWLAGRALLGIGWVADRFDSLVVDGAVNGVGAAGIAAGAALRRAQSGHLQTYAWALFAGMVALALIVAVPLVLGRG